MTYEVRRLGDQVRELNQKFNVDREDHLKLRKKVQAQARKIKNLKDDIMGIKLDLKLICKHAQIHDWEIMFKGKG